MTGSLSGGDVEVLPEDARAAVRCTAARASAAVRRSVTEQTGQQRFERAELDAAADRLGRQRLTDEEWAAYSSGAGDAPGGEAEPPGLRA
ncbi:hypothetical protein Sme01_62580 [Sphaerisporangium melleum]|uniref:Uncharacterized protein n=1 Tax=Sphaerisporangium melleum TaxID=321316 RepID=A0A917VHA1_9ACTN|nr:hypothetical protein GCM10007964_25760 [Sphaerisporangium melleum]GII73782.1 hypothetical protein Sme01_62580 [Sphaerisporangium melleum]